MSESIEHGVRFLPPHVNADEVIGPFPLEIAVTFLGDGMSELVRRQVGPWEQLTSPCDCHGLSEHQERCEGREGWADQW